METTLELLENELEPRKFFRINHKFFVNIHAIKDMVSYTNSRLQIKLKTYNADEVIVARELVKKTILYYIKKYPIAETPLLIWYNEFSKPEFFNSNELKKVYGNASIVNNNRVVFNIKGNDLG